MTNLFTKATKKKLKLRLAITGVPGSGKTYSSLMLAKGIGGKIAFIDTEQGSASLYSDKFDFDVLELNAPYTVESYINAINSAEQVGYEILIIDSLSHAWAGEGGILDRVDAITKSSAFKNSYMSWNQGTKEQNKLINKILSSNMHIISCMRSKIAYEIVENDKGKKAPQKMGLAPIQRDSLEYEFSIVFDIARDSHLATASKNRSNLFNDDVPFLITEETGTKIVEWLNSGEELKPTVKKDNAVITNFNEYATDMVSKAKDSEELKSIYREALKHADTEDKKRLLIELSAQKKSELNNNIGE